MKNFNCNNRVNLIGKLEKPFEYGYEFEDKVFYLTTLLVKRTSGTYDRIPVCITKEKLTEMTQQIYDGKVYIEGFIVSYRNVYGSLKVKVRINKLIPALENKEDINIVSMVGEITNDPVVRTTPSGRNIADLGFIIHAGGRMNFYVPVICWGNVANMVKNYSKKSMFSIKARFQSRTYEKRLEDGTYEERETVELSVFKCYPYNNF